MTPTFKNTLTVNLGPSHWIRVAITYRDVDGGGYDCEVTTAERPTFSAAARRGCLAFAVKNVSRDGLGRFANLVGDMIGGSARDVIVSVARSCEIEALARFMNAT